MPGQNPVLLCQDMITTLVRDLTLSNGVVIPAGTKVLLLPQTIADCVLTPDGDSLAEAWPSISRKGHSHDEIVAFSEELVRIANRETVSETTLAEYSGELIRYATRLAKVEARLAELESGSDPANITAIGESNE